MLFNYTLTSVKSGSKCDRRLNVKRKLVRTFSEMLHHQQDTAGTITMRA